MKTRFIGIAISAVAFLNFWPFQPAAADALMPVEIALGNWPPVIEDKRPGYGAVTEKITIVLRRMGYQPTYSFMPWDQAVDKVESNEIDSGPRITFPYLKTNPRETLFLYSEMPVHQDCMKFFYHKGKIRNPDITRLSTWDDLRDDLIKYRIGYRKASLGFQYPDELNKILKDSKDTHFKGLYDAFEKLTNDNELAVQVVPAEQKIGEHLLIELFPDAREKIGLLEKPATGRENACLLPVDYFLLVSRKNPNNAEFIDRFDKEFKDFLADKEAVARNARREKERGSLLQPLVRLDGLPSRSYILADTKSGKRIHIPRGTRGILLKWNSPAKAKDDSPHVTAKVRLISGPYRGLTVTISGDHLRLE